MNWTIEPFDKSRHDRAGFDCGEQTLNDWLSQRISQFEKKNLARSYVLLRANQPTVLGYYSLSNHTVIYDVLPADQSRGLPHLDVPVVLIGRLAVDRTVQGQGLGEYLLVDALKRCLYLARQIGIRAVEVDAATESAVRFYQKYGFLTLKDDPRHLFLPMRVIQELKLLS